MSNIKHWFFHTEDETQAVLKPHVKNKTCDVCCKHNKTKQWNKLYVGQMTMDFDIDIDLILILIFDLNWAETHLSESSGN